MAYAFLDRLNLEHDEREKLHALADAGSETPFKLLALYRASPHAFAAHVGGEERAMRIAGELDRLLTEFERSLLAEEPPQFPTGALLDVPPKQ